MCDMIYNVYNNMVFNFFFYMLEFRFEFFKFKLKKNLRLLIYNMYEIIKCKIYYIFSKYKKNKILKYIIVLYGF
jgi:hypothetical protein